MVIVLVFIDTHQVIERRQVCLGDMEEEGVEEEEEDDEYRKNDIDKTDVEDSVQEAVGEKKEEKGRRGKKET